MMRSAGSYRGIHECQLVYTGADMMRSAGSYRGRHDEVSWFIQGQT